MARAKKNLLQEAIQRPKLCVYTKKIKIWIICFVLYLALFTIVTTLSCDKQPVTEDTSHTNKNPITVDMSHQEIRLISIMTPSIWNLQIISDGSGYIVWAASSHPNSGALFPKGTLDFQKAVTTLQSMPSSEDEKSLLLTVAFFHVNESSAVSQQIPVDSVWAKELFTKAFLSSDKTGTRVEGLWKKYPPFHDKNTEDGHL